MLKKNNQYILASLALTGLIVGFSACSNSSKSPDNAAEEKTEHEGVNDFKGSGNEETPVAHSFIWDSPDQYETRPWKHPKYEEQPKFIGYSKDAFVIPEGLEENVKFWKSIYQKYNSDQGVVHDSQHINLVYEEIDFQNIMNNPSFDHSAKLKERRKMVDAAKDRVREAISKIAKQETLDGYAQALKVKIEKYSEKNILNELPQNGRLRFQLGQKNYIQQGIFHSGAYMDQIEEVFQSYGIPKQLIRLAFVESSFNLKARSKVGASGVWQIMPATARGKRLPMSYYYDYRNHPIEASHAAAKLLKFNFKVLEDWPRAVTAYNFGAAGMKRLSKNFKTTEIGQLADERHRRWGFAASNFYASFLAVLDTEANVDQYFGKDFKVRVALESDTYKLPKNLSWSWVKENVKNVEQFMQLNPQFNYSRFNDNTILSRNLLIHLPKSSSNAFNEAQKHSKVIAISDHFEIHRVSSGESVYSIARKYGVSMNSILAANELSRSNLIYIGQSLKVPLLKSR